MNPFFYEGTNSELVLTIFEVKNQTIDELYRKGFKLITVRDAKYKDNYSIRLQKATINGCSYICGMCFLNYRASYQADFKGARPLKDIINAMAGFNIID